MKQKDRNKLQKPTPWIFTACAIMLFFTYCKKHMFYLHVKSPKFIMRSFLVPQLIPHFICFVFLQLETDRIQQQFKVFFDLFSPQTKLFQMPLDLHILGFSFVSYEACERTNDVLNFFLVVKAQSVVFHICIRSWPRATAEVVFLVSYEQAVNDLDTSCE